MSTEADEQPVSLDEIIKTAADAKDMLDIIVGDAEGRWNALTEDERAHIDIEIAGIAGDVLGLAREVIGDPEVTEESDD